MSLTVAAAVTTYDPDLFHVLALARESVARGALPRSDPFAFTPTLDPVVHHEWLTGMLLHRIVSSWGGGGLMAVKFLLHLGTLALVVWVALRNGVAAPTLGFLGPLAIGMGAPGLTTLRAQVITLTLVALLLLFLDVDRRGRRWWMAAFVPLHVVWLNCHGGFVVAPVIIGLHGIEELLRGRPVRHLVLLLPVLAITVLANPYGPTYVSYLAHAIGMDRSIILEWRPLGDGHPIALPIMGLSLLVFFYSWLPGNPLAKPGWLIVILAALAAIRHQRHISLYALVWFAYVPAMAESGSLGRTFRALWNARPIVTRACLVLGIALGVARAVQQRRWELTLPTVADGPTAVAYPVGVVDYLTSQAASGRMVTPFEVGAFVTWKMYPAMRVSLDGRFEAAYPAPLVHDHIRFYAGLPGWADFLERYPSEFVLAKRRDGIVGALAHAGGRWRITYEDDTFVLFTALDAPMPYVDRRGEWIAGTFP